MPVLLDFDVLRMDREHRDERGDAGRHDRHAVVHVDAQIEEKAVNRQRETRQHGKDGERRYQDPQFALDHDALRKGAATALKTPYCLLRRRRDAVARPCLHPGTGARKGKP